MVLSWGSVQVQLASLHVIADCCVLGGIA